MTRFGFKAATLTSGIVICLTLAGCSGPDESTEPRVPGQAAAPPQAPLSIQGDLADPATESQVRETWMTYKTAVAVGQGPNALPALSRSTFQYYGQMQAMAISGSREQLLELPMVDLLLAMFMRHRMPRETLHTASPEDLVVYGIENGWVGRAQVAPLQMTDVRMRGEKATGRMTINGQDFVNTQFVRDDDAWKLDLVSMLRQAEPTLQAGLAQNGLTPSGFLRTALAGVGVEKTDEQLWELPPAP